MWFQHILPTMSKEVQTSEMSAASLQPILYITDESNTDEYQNYILPLIQNFFQIPKSIQVRTIFNKSLNFMNHHCFELFTHCLIFYNKQKRC